MTQSLETGKEWQRHRGDPKRLLKLIQGGTAPVVEKGNGTATAGMKAAQLYREIRPGDDPLSESVMDALFKTARASGDSRLASKKRIVLLSPGGFVLVSTPGEILRKDTSGRRMWVKSVATIARDGRIVHRPYHELLHDGWKPLAAIKTDVTAKNEVETYSFQQWDEIRKSILSVVQNRLDEVQSGIAEISEHSASEIVGNEETDVGQRGCIAAVPNPPLFSPERQPDFIELAWSDVECLIKAIGVPRWRNIDEARKQINDAIEQMPVLAIQRILDKLSPKDVNSNARDYRTGLTLLENHIYEASRKGRFIANEFGRVATRKSGKGFPDAEAVESADSAQVSAHCGKIEKRGIPAARLLHSDNGRIKLNGTNERDSRIRPRGRARKYAVGSTSIRLLPPKDFHSGRCVVCGLVRYLKWRDHELGLMGDCCLGAAILADKNLQAVNTKRPVAKMSLPL